MLIYLQMIEDEADRTKFEQVYLHYRNLMFHVANDILNDWQEAEDAVHQAFIAIAKHIDGVSEAICPRTQGFVVTIVTNKAIDIYRAKKRRVVRPLEEDTVKLCFRTTGSPVADAIARLPERYREVILLKYDAGYTNQEVADLLGKTYESIHSLDRRAKQALREELAKEGIEV